MRAWLAAAAGLCVSALAGLVAIPLTFAVAQDKPQTCRGVSGALGVARTVEIDTAKGPRLGKMQYKDIDFLGDREVVLTFDDGPSRTHTRAVLDALDAHCTKATFFMVGRMAVADPDMAREVDRRGHTIGTHSWSHANIRALGAARAVNEIELGISSVSRALGKPVAPFFRFPYLADSAASMAHLEKRNIANISIDVDSKDFRTHDGRQMQGNVMRALAQSGKGIILMHDIQTSTANGIMGLLNQLKANGYRVVHLVPKAPVATVASFDESAANLLTRKSAAAGANPMTKRSVVWPIGSAAPPPTAAVSKGGPAAGGPTGASAPAAPRPAPAPAADPAPPPVLRGPADDWSAKVFGH